MTDERLCASGHVIDAGRETCSRCNGHAVNQAAPEAPAEAPVEATEEAPAEATPETVAEAPAEEVAPETTEEEAPADENVDETPATEAVG